MNLKKQVKLKSIEKDMTLVQIAKKIGISRQNYNEKLNRNDKETIRKTEKILGLKSGFFEDNTEN